MPGHVDFGRPARRHGASHLVLAQRRLGRAGGRLPAHRGGAGPTLPMGERPFLIPKAARGSHKGAEVRGHRRRQAPGLLLLVLAAVAVQQTHPPASATSCQLLALCLRSRGEPRHGLAHQRLGAGRMGALPRARVSARVHGRHDEARRGREIAPRERESCDKTFARNLNYLCTSLSLSAHVHLF